MNNLRNKYGYERTILYIYPYLSKMAQVTRNRMEIRASLSYKMEKTEELLKELLEDGYKADRLDEIKVKLKQVVEAIPKKERLALDYRFCHRHSSKAYERQMKELGISERSFFRLIWSGLERVSLLLYFNDMGEDWFLREFSAHDWAMDVYNRCRKGQLLHKRRDSVFNKKRVDKKAIIASIQLYAEGKLGES